MSPRTRRRANPKTKISAIIIKAIGLILVYGLVILDICFLCSLFSFDILPLRYYAIITSVLILLTSIIFIMQ